MPLPVGLRPRRGRATSSIDPDEEVAAAISDVFAAFTATGSAYGVAGAFAGRRFPRRAYGGAWAGQLRWGRLTHARAAGILRNPAYAGAYVFGRRRSRAGRRTRTGQCTPSVTELPRDQWEVLIPDHHPGYISWEDYLANEAKLAANRTNAGARPPREGHRAVPGHRVLRRLRPVDVQVRYQDRLPALRVRPLPRRPCRHAALRVGARRHHRRRGRRTRCWPRSSPTRSRWRWPPPRRSPPAAQRSVRAAELAVERARYDAERAERAFLACEPENRLVARTLEARWETRLAEPGRGRGRRWPRSARPSPSCPPRPAGRAPSPTCPRCGSAATTSDKDRKRLLRTLLADVTITPVADDPTQIRSGCAGSPAPASSSPVTRRSNAIQLRCHRPGRDRSSPAASAPAWTTPPWPPRSTTPGTAPAPGSPSTASPPATCATTTTSPTPDLLDDGELTPRQVAELTGVSHRHHPLLDQRRLPARPPRPGRALVHPLPARGRSRLPRPRRRARPTSTATPTRHPAATTSSASPRPPAGSASSPTSSTTGRNGATSPPAAASAGRLWIDFTPAVEHACLQRIASSYKLPADIKTQAAQRLERIAV